MGQSQRRRRLVLRVAQLAVRMLQLTLTKKNNDAEISSERRGLRQYFKNKIK
jgi:hypothetical protein